MHAARIRKLLEGLERGSLDVASVAEELQRLPYADLGFARVDHHREIRQGAPEVVLGAGKTPKQVVAIVRSLMGGEQNVLVTRVSEALAEGVQTELPEVRYNQKARTLSLTLRAVEAKSGPPVALVTAGTSDVPVAEEAAETLTFLGLPFERVFDVGVAGIHRLFGELDRLMGAPAVIVVAGMEGALPSVVGGLVAAPVIAVPTSVGYGVSEGGYAALLGMLSCCAAGVTVVNIDNGFGAAMAVGRILRQSPCGNETTVATFERERSG